MANGSTRPAPKIGRMTKTVYERRMDTFAKRLQTARKAKFPALSAAKYAETKLHIAPATYRTYERGDAEPGFDTLHRICETLGITPNYLFPEVANPDVNDSGPEPERETA